MMNRSNQNWPNDTAAEIPAEPTTLLGPDIEIVYGSPFKVSDNTVNALTDKGRRFLKADSVTITGGSVDLKAFYMKENAASKGLIVATRRGEL